MPLHNKTVGVVNCFISIPAYISDNSNIIRNEQYDIITTAIDNGKANYSCFSFITCYFSIH